MSMQECWTTWKERHPHKESDMVPKPWDLKSIYLFSKMIWVWKSWTTWKERHPHKESDIVPKPWDIKNVYWFSNIIWWRKSVGQQTMRGKKAPPLLSSLSGIGQWHDAQTINNCIAWQCSMTWHLQHLLKALYVKVNVNIGQSMRIA